MMIINSENILASAFTFVQQDQLSVDELWDYYTALEDKLKAISIDPATKFSIETFLREYEYAFYTSDDGYYVRRKEDFDQGYLDAYFRMDYPEVIVKLFEEAGQGFRKRNCNNCCYGTYITNEEGESLYCDMSKFGEYSVDTEKVSPDHCCEDHIFVDDNFFKDESDDQHKKARQKVI